MQHFLFLVALVAGLPLAAQLDFSLARPLSGPHIDRMDSRIDSGKYGAITSVLVARNGRLLLERYYGGHDSTSLHNTRSTTKTLATLLAGIAIDRGHIGSERDPIRNYLGMYWPLAHPDPRKDSITLEDLLTMSSVLECDDQNHFSRGQEERMYLIEDWTRFLLDLPVRAYTFGPRPEDSPYGRVFAYASAKAAAVGDIVGRAAGEPLDEFARRELFGPLGIEHFRLDYTPLGVLNTAGGSEYRSRDFLKLIQLCLNGGRWNDRQVISAEWIAKATSPQVAAGEGMEYGYFFWLRNFGRRGDHPAFSMAGNGGNKVMAIPSLGLTIVITATNYNVRAAHGYTDELVNDFLLPAVTGE